MERELSIQEQQVSNEKSKIEIEKAKVKLQEKDGEHNHKVQMKIAKADFVAKLMISGSSVTMSQIESALKLVFES